MSRVLNFLLILLLDQQPPQLQSSFVKLRFRGADRDAHYAGDLFVLKSFDVVEHEYIPVPIWQFRDCVLESNAVEDLHFVRISCARYRLLGHFAVFRSSLILDAAPPPEMHQYLIDRQAVQPCRKCGIATKAADLAKELDENFLG